MQRSRKHAWLRDELILALSLYRRAGPKPPLNELDELSQLLRSIPIELELASNPSFRGRDSVYLKLANFTSLDPTADRKGMTRCGRGDRIVWEEFADNPARLGRVARTIQDHIGAFAPVAAEGGEEGMVDAPEGRILTRVHQIRERNGKLAARKKAEAMAIGGKLVCEVCDFDFTEVYGAHGRGFIECHHIVPLSELKSGSITRTADLALVCSNCHRMIHHRSPWLSIAQLRALVCTAAE